MFSFRQCDDRVGIGAQAALVVAFDARALEELVHADPAAEPRGRVGRQAVARPRDVIARRHR